MKSSRQDLLNDVVEGRTILKNYPPPEHKPGWFRAYGAVLASCCKKKENALIKVKMGVSYSKLVILS